MKREYCNPVNLEYKFQHYGKSAHREAADPTLVLFKDRYYMFASMSAGFYHSDDLANWAWHENRNLEIYSYAPDVRANGEYLYFCASGREPMSIWRTKDPFAESYERVSTPFPFWDPDMFFDDDGRVYFFWGCGTTEPIYGVELDNKTFMPIGEKTPLIYEGTTEHGFERFNYPGKEDTSANMGFLTRIMHNYVNRKGLPYIEGAFCNKFNGKYYLQYAAPAANFPVYADGVYVADKPLGPYAYQRHNPFSFKPSGFINGAGHGSTIADRHGNLWHASTMRVCVNAVFERRIGLFPAGVDEDGTLYCNQNFADYPIVILDGKFDARNLEPRYMLLSYKKKAAASSVLGGHGAELALNENIRDWWCAKGSAGEWLTVDLGKVYGVHSVQINLAEGGIPVVKKPKGECGSPVVSGRYIDSGRDLRTRYTLEVSADGEIWQVVHDASGVQTDKTHDYVVFEPDIRTRFLRVTAVELAYGQKFALSGLRVFGLDNGAKPDMVTVAHTTRPDPTTANVTWVKARGAIGYNVRYGIDRDKLYSSHLVYEKNEVLLTALNAGEGYWVCVDSFNESGVTAGKPVEMTKYKGA